MRIRLFLSCILKRRFPNNIQIDKYEKGNVKAKIDLTSFMNAPLTNALLKYFD